MLVIEELVKTISMGYREAMKLNISLFAVLLIGSLQVYASQVPRIYIVETPHIIAYKEGNILGVKGVVSRAHHSTTENPKWVYLDFKDLPDVGGELYLESTDSLVVQMILGATAVKQRIEIKAERIPFQGGFQYRIHSVTLLPEV